MLHELSISQAKELQPLEGQVPPSQVSTLAAKIIHSSLCDILKERGSEASDYTDIRSDNSASVETLATSVRREVIDYQLQGPLVKASSSTIFEPLESGLIAEEVLQKANKISAQCQSSTTHTIRVSHGFLEDVITKLLSKILPEHSNLSSSAEKENQIAEFDFIHMKLVSKVMTEITKNQKLIIQYVKCLHQNDATIIERVVESVYNKLLQQFGSLLTIQKCVKSGCTILSEAIADLVLREVSGNQLQTLFSGELTPRQCAEADNVVEDMLRDLTEPSDHTNPITSDISELSSLIIEELSAKLLHKLLSIFPIVHLDAQNISSVTDITSKIMNSLQVLLSKNQMKIHENINQPDSLQDDSKAIGDFISSVYTRIMKPSDSDISIHKDLTSKNDVLANRTSSLMIRGTSKPEFQPISEEESPPSSSLMLEAVNIVKKILTNMEMMKIQKQPSASHISVLHVTFVEEILSRFLTKILKSTHSTNPEQRRSLSKTEVTEVAGKLKQSMENLMSKNKISLVEAAGDMANPEYDDTLNQVAHTIYNNVLQISGSQQDFYNDVTSSQTNMPQQIASIIINEISNCHLALAFKDSPPMDSQSTIALDRIVERIRAQVSLNTVPESEWSREPIGDDNANEQPTETMLPVEIIPHIGNKVLQVDPDILSKHLAVISIKTESLAELKKACLAQTGLSLTDLRRASMAGKGPVDETSGAEGKKKKEICPSLDVSGRLDVKSKEPASRNSFWDMLKPDIARVELLKDVENQQDLIMRLVTHDIEAKAMQQGEEGEAAFEKIVKVESSLIFESQPLPDTEGREDAAPACPLEKQRNESEASLPEVRPSTSSQKKFLSLSKCCQALSNSIPEDIEDIVREIKDDQDNLRLVPLASTQNSVMASPSAGKEDLYKVKLIFNAGIAQVIFQLRISASEVFIPLIAILLCCNIV
ncbi:fibrous sheath-interacting protein 2 [Emydura macquarii macquarii]|uniref:fibrous sheath-interacting protein 2 n=1 Tax=Emydura macquarii macquarii TaxID=1129001 RepID=UPI00352B64C7